MAALIEAKADVNRRNNVRWSGDAVWVPGCIIAKLAIILKRHLTNTLEPHSARVCWLWSASPVGVTLLAGRVGVRVRTRAGHSARLRLRYWPEGECMTRSPCKCRRSTHRLPCMHVAWYTSADDCCCEPSFCRPGCANPGEGRCS